MADDNMKLDRNSPMKSLNDARDEIQVKLNAIEYEYTRASRLDPQYVELVAELRRLEACVRLKIMVEM